MLKWSEKEIMLFAIFLFAGLFIWINTTLLNDFITIIRPFINGFILAYLTGILASIVEKKLPFKAAKGISILIVYGLIFLVFSLVIVRVVPLIIFNIQLFLDNYNYYVIAMVDSEILSYFETLNLNEIMPRLAGKIFEISSYAKSFTSGAFNGILTFIISIYVLVSRETIVLFLRRLLGVFLQEKKVDQIFRSLVAGHRMFQKYLLTQLIVSLILGITSAIILLFLGVNYAILIGTIMGLSNIIPVFGGIIGTVFSSFLLFTSNSSFLALIGLVFLLFLQQLEGNFLTPKLLGNVLELSPIMILFALLIGSSYFGFVGILFAVPVCAMIKGYLRARIKEREG